MLFRCGSPSMWMDCHTVCSLAPISWAGSYPCRPVPNSLFLGGGVWGGVGRGGAVKICNNMLLAISMIGTSEAMNLGIR